MARPAPRRAIARRAQRSRAGRGKPVRQTRSGRSNCRQAPWGGSKTLRVRNDRPSRRKQSSSPAMAVKPRDCTAMCIGVESVPGVLPRSAFKERERVTARILRPIPRTSRESIGMGLGIVASRRFPLPHSRQEPLFPQSKRQPVVDLPRLRLPLPERTGSDRDELLSPHGFVDRAYSVFLLRCVSLLRTSHCIYRATVGASIPPLSCYSPDAGSHLRALLHRGVNEGTSPRAHPRPLLLRLRYDVPCLERPAGNCLGGGPEGRAPMEVPDLRASRPNDWNPTPPARSPTTVGLRLE